MGAHAGFMPIRYDRVLTRSPPRFARLRIASFPPPVAGIWAPPPHALGCAASYTSRSRAADTCVYTSVVCNRA